MNMMRAEYIWIDGAKPTQTLRSKTKVLPAGTAEMPIWGFDGSSTGQAEGHDSDGVLRPVFVCPDPIRGGEDKLVLCEVLLTDMTAHPSNTRAACAATSEQYASFDTWFGIEQEYTFFEGARPLGWPDTGFPAPQFGYYCGVGADEVFGRPIVEAHTDACIEAGLHICGTNAEVMPGQWEFQIGPVATPQAADELWVARFLLYRIAEDFNVSATLDPKPVRGDWNGAGAHTNFSTQQMRESFDACVAAAEALEPKHAVHIASYGHGVEDRLTGEHETARHDEFTWGVSNRGARRSAFPGRSSVMARGTLRTAAPTPIWIPTW